MRDSCQKKSRREVFTIVIRENLFFLALQYSIIKEMQVSADIAAEYLARIGYDPDMAKEIVQGIGRHNLTDTLPEDMSVFQTTIRDSDDIDRFDIIRIAMAMGSSVHEKTNVEIIESCQKQIDIARWYMTLPRGTKTAKDMMDKELTQRIELLEQIIAQAKKGFE